MSKNIIRIGFLQQEYEATNKVLEALEDLEKITKDHFINGFKLTELVDSFHDKLYELNQEATRIVKTVKQADNI